MLYTRNAFYFRKFYKEKIARESGRIDLNFVGSLHPDKKRRETGFSKLIYGNREDIGKLLGTIALNVAADDQAIYELIQNADDCKSTFFSVSYNEDYLLCINNGDYFSDKDMSAIINVAGNYKDGEDIGTFGIGFKILHRLVGRDDGRDAIINDYAGPIIFSWNKFFQLNAFLNDDEIKVGYDAKKDSENPWLIKLLYTCFPSHLDEKLRLQDFDTQGVKFSKEELSEMRAFLKQSLQNVNLKETNNLKSGSIFFLKLGKGKNKFLDDGIDKIKSGLSYSFKFLNNLKKIYIKGEEIKAKTVSDYSCSYPFNSLEFNQVNPKNKNRDIKFTFAYYRDYKKANDLQNELVPNLYTFFSMDEEKNGFSFLLHCNAFDMNNDRRKLQANSQINEKLLPVIAKDIIDYTDKQKEHDHKLFLSLYANFLLSKEPKSKPHIDNSFYKFIHTYITQNIPTKDGNYSNNPQNVKINKLKSQLNLTDFGLGHIQWFEWDNEVDQLLIDEATKEEKLGLKSWDIADIVENANLESINKWIETCEKKIYEAFLIELEGRNLRRETKEKICQIKLFKFSNGTFYSFNDVVKKVRSNQSTQYRTIYNYNYSFSNLFFTTSKNEGISDELHKLGIYLSDINIFKYPNILSALEKMPDEKQMFNFIAEKCKTNTLSSKEKKKLFLNFINETRKFDNVGKETLKDLCLFFDTKSVIKPLSALVSFSFKTPVWLNSYKVKEGEYFPELDPYLIQEDELFAKIILPNIEIIKDELTEVDEIKGLVNFFKDNHRPFFNEYIIQKLINGFKIIDKTDKHQIIPPKDERKAFIDFISTQLSDKLIVLSYDFSEFNNEDGIVKGEDLHSQILEYVDVNEHKKVLVEILLYRAKHKFLQKLSEFRFNAKSAYTKEDYEFKIIELACSELKENDYQKFRQRVEIEKDGQIYKLSDISLFADKITIANREFSLSKVLPLTYQNSDLISDLITQFKALGIQNEKLNTLFGVNEELGIDDVFEKFKDQTETLENPEQFFFLVYYHQENPESDISKLAFDLNHAVFPSEYALKNEKLPEYLQQWINNDEVKLPELEKSGIWTENTVLVELRKFLKGEINEFSNNRLAQDTRFNEDETMLFNTFEWLKEKNIKLSAPEQFESFKKIVDIINESRKSKGDLIIQEEYNFEFLMENSTIWQETENFTILLYDGQMPLLIGLDEIKEYIFYSYQNGDYAVNNNIIYINSKKDKMQTLLKVASDDKNKFSSKELLELFGERNEDENEEDQDTNTTFLDEVNQFIADELEDTEWSDYIPDLKNLLQDFNNHPQEKQKLFNLIAKIKLTKEKHIKYEDSDEGFNVIKIGNEKFFVHSARGAFAYIHPNEILKMINEGYKMALDFNTKSRIKIYENAEDILELNTNHILAFQGDKPFEDLIAFCEANRGEKKHLLIIDKDNANEKSKAYLKLFNNSEDDYQ